MTKTEKPSRIRQAIAALALTASALTGCASPAAHHAATDTRCRHEIVKQVRYSECESRTGDKVTYTFTQVSTWTVR